MRKACTSTTDSFLYIYAVVKVPTACASVTKIEDESSLLPSEFVSDNFTASQKDIEEVEEGMKKLGLRNSQTADEG